MKHNKAVCLIRYSSFLKDIGSDGKGLDHINKSLEIFQQISDKTYEDEAWDLKGMFSEMFDDIAEAFNCYKRALELASKDSDMKQTYEKNRDKLLPLIENMDVLCPNCAEKLKITDSFCIKCGANIAESIKQVLKNHGSGENVERNVEHEEVCDAYIMDFEE